MRNYNTETSMTIKTLHQIQIKMMLKNNELILVLSKRLKITTLLQQYYVRVSLKIK